MIWTSYFGNWRKFPSGYRQVSIARGVPNGIKSIELSSFNCVRPTTILLSDFKDGLITKELYTQRYLKQLELLNIEDFLLSYDNSILLCYEKSDSFCHRHLLRRYINARKRLELIREL